MQTPTQQQGWAATSYQAQPQAEQQLLLGRYRVVETRGTGGFGAVHVCWDTRLERKVAIKCMPLEPAAGMSASTLAEALDEARITSRLTHPNIVTVHDFAVQGSVAYLIMEYVNGLTLGELMGRVEGGTLTYDECAHLLSSLAGALDYAHENDVLHLDIKPSNVFIDSAGNIKLGDFGMASLASAAGWEGARGGTVGYMPPEQLNGELVDERTDVFALAVVCYQALVGASPFAAKDAEASLKKIQKGARPLAKVESELAGPVSEQIAEALSADAGLRPSTAGDLARAVLPYLGDEDEGRKSVASLMAQATGEPDPYADAWEHAANLPLVERYPWLPAAFSRALCALACGLVGLRCVPAVVAMLGVQAEPLACAALGFLVPAALAATVPQAGGAVAGVALVGALFSVGVYSPAFLVAMLAVAGLVAWLLTTSYKAQLSHAALFMASALGSGAGSSAVAGACLPAGAAAVTAALGCALSFLLVASAGAASADEFVAGCVALVASGGTWVRLAGSALAAAACALLSRNHGKGANVAGQVACAAILIAAWLVALRVENGGLWGVPNVGDIAVALGCSLLMTFAVAGLGPIPNTWEDE